MAENLGIEFGTRRQGRQSWLAYKAAAVKGVRRSITKGAMGGLGRERHAYEGGREARGVEGGTWCFLVTLVGRSSHWWAGVARAKLIPQPSNHTLPSLTCHMRPDTTSLEDTNVMGSSTSTLPSKSLNEGSTRLACAFRAAMCLRSKKNMTAGPKIGGNGVMGVSPRGPTMVDVSVGVIAVTANGCDGAAGGGGGAAAAGGGGKTPSTGCCKVAPGPGTMPCHLAWRIISSQCLSLRCRQSVGEERHSSGAGVIATSHIK